MMTSSDPSRAELASLPTDCLRQPEGLGQRVSQLLSQRFCPRFSHLSSHLQKRLNPLAINAGVLSVLLLSLLLSGCARTSPPKQPLQIDTSLNAIAQRSRVDVIVVHYTHASLPRSLGLLTRSMVSSHYLVTDEQPPRIYRLVDETQSAWHAGESEWYGKTALNARSIGIEIVHPGWEPNLEGLRGPDFREDQVAIVAALIQDIAARHDVAPHNIVGHSDVAPLRKQDPGPAFPWRLLAQLGIGRWFDEDAARTEQAHLELTGLPDARQTQQALKRIGYPVTVSGEWDKQTHTVLAAFQMHYRPEKIDGILDAHTAAILAVMPTTGSAELSML